MSEDKLAKYRRRLTRAAQEAYRPEIAYASVSEAKEIFKKRYKKQGIKVTRVRRRDHHFVVSFGEDKHQRGLGPNGLKWVLCNWPYRYNAGSYDEAVDLLRKNKLLPPLEKKKKKQIRKRTIKKTKSKRKHKTIKKGKS